MQAYYYYYCLSLTALHQLWLHLLFNFRHVLHPTRAKRSYGYRPSSVLALDSLNTSVDKFSSDNMSGLFSSPYFTEEKNGITQFQLLQAYLLGSAFQTVCDNPVTAYRQLVQQYSTDLSGKIVSPEVASAEAKKTFRSNPIGASLSGLWEGKSGFKKIIAQQRKHNIILII